MKILRIKCCFVSPKVPKARAGFNFMFVILIFVENYLLYDATNVLTVWLRTGSNPADINQF